ncbi:MAG: universal stress protein [Desulfobulbaceae bacterium]|nr:universal stress protein [Desulfobulbaceae bacterium]
MLEDVRKILVPVDFSENSQKILMEGQLLAEKLQAKLAVVFVVQSIDDYSGFFVPHMPLAQFEEELLEGAKKKMKSFLAENLKGAVCDSAVLAGDVAEEILAYAQRNGVGMIVMGTHGYKGLEKVLFGSVAEQVVKNAPCPVLTINPYK